MDMSMVSSHNSSPVVMKKQSCTLPLLEPDNSATQIYHNMDLPRLSEPSLYANTNGNMPSPTEGVLEGGEYEQMRVEKVGDQQTLKDDVFCEDHQHLQTAEENDYMYAEL